MDEHEPRPVGWSPPWRHGPRVRHALLALVVVAVVVGAVVWWLGSRPPRAEAGELVDLSGAVTEDFPADELPVAATTMVFTPATPVELTIGKPVDQLSHGLRAVDGGDDDDGDDDDGDDDQPAYLAASDESFVPVRWRTDVGYTIPPSPVEDPDDPGAEDLPAPTLSIVVDGEVIGGPVDVTDTSAGAVAVSVADDAEVRIEVGFDGATQTVDARSGELDAGVAEAYYVLNEDVGLLRGGCGFVHPPAPGLAYQPGCTVDQAAVAPWRPGAGWVDEPGQAWAGVSYRWVVPNAFDTDEPASRYYIRDDARLGSPRLADGTEPDVLRGRAGQDASGRVRYAGWLLDTAPSRLVVVATGRGEFERRIGDAPAGRVGVELTLRLSVPTGT